MEIKNAKAIQGKSRAHKVSQEGSRFSVVSGTSGSTYSVELLGIGGAQCSCDWAMYRPARTGRKSGCSHVVAVYHYLACEQGRSAMSWASPEAAGRQHRPMLAIGDGVTLTTRGAIA